jgi:hypothetical protein
MRADSAKVARRAKNEGRRLQPAHRQAQEFLPDVVVAQRALAPVWRGTTASGPAASCIPELNAPGESVSGSVHAQELWCERAARSRAETSLDSAYGTTGALKRRAPGMQRRVALGMPERTQGPGPCMLRLVQIAAGSCAREKSTSHFAAGHICRLEDTAESSSEEHEEEGVGNYGRGVPTGVPGPDP